MAQPHLQGAPENLKNFHTLTGCLSENGLLNSVTAKLQDMYHYLLASITVGH
jgi:hypothetical protein